MSDRQPQPNGPTTKDLSATLDELEELGLANFRDGRAALTPLGRRVLTVAARKPPPEPPGFARRLMDVRSDDQSGRAGQPHASPRC